jgi:hypothetical protein
LLLVACGQRPDSIEVAGRFLRIQVDGLESHAEVGYTVDGIAYAVRPAAPDGRIVALRLRVENPNAVLASLLFDKGAAFLDDTERSVYRPLNPWVQREAVDRALPRDQTVMPLLWGPVTLEKGFWIEGWMLFEVPKEAELSTGTWEQADFIKFLLPS